jgi:diaminopimelate decarboxylase
MQAPNFITRELVSEIQNNYQTPVYVYSEKELRERAQEFMSFPSVFGHSVRYAMKANPQKNILKIFNEEGLLIDASSDFEAMRAISAGIPAENIQISSQEL